MPTFTTPVAFTGPRLLPGSRGPERCFFRRASALPVGQTVLKESGVYSTVQNPDANRVAAAQAVYLGGHVYEVNATIAAELTAAGYGNYLS